MEIFLVLLKLTCSWRSILISSGWSPIQCSKSSCICPLELFIPASWSTLLCYLRTWDGNDLATLWQSRTCASQNFFQFLRLIRSFQCQLQFCLHSVLDSRTRSSFWGSKLSGKTHRTSVSSSFFWMNPQIPLSSTTLNWSHLKFT